MKHRLAAVFPIVPALAALLIAGPVREGAVAPGLLTALRVVMVLLVAGDVVLRVYHARYRSVYLRHHLPDIALLVVMILYVAADARWEVSTTFPGAALVVEMLVVLRSGYYALRVFARMRKLVDFLVGITAYPAQTIVTSFLVVILAGTVLLMLPFTGSDGAGLRFLDALFTATSAVCVTGLIVVDTATAFSVWGQAIILILIQIGGLGIIILSYFVIFTIRRSVGVADKLLLAYTLSEGDLTRLARSLKAIVAVTFVTEAVGAVLLFFPMKAQVADIASAVFYSVFHAVSAFCNAGFALFTDSLERFVHNIGVNLVFAGLIVIGGLSFAVINNLIPARNNRAEDRRRETGRTSVSVNTKVVLVTSTVLVVTAFFGIYGLEHAGAMRHLPLGTQYLSSFFQSVTLRTAGFNTIGFAGLAESTLLFMMVFMIIGGASGSTAGGIKVNTAAVLFFLVRSRVANRRQPLAFGQSISDEIVMRSVLIVLFAVSVCALFGILLSITEDAPLSQILFETVSAFGTVGLSAGLTPNLTSVGRVAVILLMFMGRLGPLTILAAAASRRRGLRVEYPSAQISIG